MGQNEEWFDVVDETDAVVGQRARSEVHREKLRHRAVHVFVVRNDGCLLIHLRSESKEEFPGVWTSSAAGHVSAGESYRQSVTRELHEELGIKTPLNRLHKFDACPDTSMEFTELYECRWDGAVSADPEEIQQNDWVAIEELVGRLARRPEQFSPAFRLLFDWYAGR
jgi:isopentenyl-diphosphate Delta-isomerase